MATIKKLKELRRNNMSLTVDTRNVENEKEVCYKKPKDGKRAYKDTTFYLAWGSMAIGIGEITYKIIQRFMQDISS